jgi:hypothetical protein
LNRKLLFVAHRTHGLHESNNSSARAVVVKREEGHAKVTAFSAAHKFRQGLVVGGCVCGLTIHPLQIGKAFKEEREVALERTGQVQQAASRYMVRATFVFLDLLKREA